MLKALKDLRDVLIFKITSERIARFDLWHFVFGIFLVWAVGIGRWWDDKQASLFHASGLSSVVYVFVLSFIIWLITRPLAFSRFVWSYKIVLIYVLLTAPPAFLYAIPVEYWMDPLASAKMNTAFLAIVSIWRVGMLVRFLRVGGEMFWGGVIGATAVLISGIVVFFGVIGMFESIAYAMGGYRDEAQRFASNVVGWAFIICLPMFFISVFVYSVYVAKARNC